MHRHARLGPLLITVLLAFIAGAGALAGPATAPTGVAAPAASPATVTPLPGDDEVTRAPTSVTRHLTAPTLVGVLAEATRPPTADSVPGGAHARQHGPATQQTGSRQGRAPPAITDR